MFNFNRSAFQGHPFHLVSPSPWPIFTCISLLMLTTSGVLTMHGFSNAGYWLLCAFILLLSSMSFWFKDVVSEGTYLGNHTLAVQRGLNMGIALFIVSEGLFYLAIFWAYFHSSLSPTVELGSQWPPLGIEAINAFELPLLNTVLLLAFGVTITYSHHSLIQGNRNGALDVLYFLGKALLGLFWFVIIVLCIIHMCSGNFIQLDSAGFTLEQYRGVFVYLGTTPHQYNIPQNTPWDMCQLIYQMRREILESQFNAPLERIPYNIRPLVPLSVVRHHILVYHLPFSRL